MNLYKNLKTLRNEYMGKQPTEIKAFVVYDSERDYTYYHFIFSEEGVYKNKLFLESTIPDTSTLFNKILEDFIKKKRIISMEYKTLKIDRSYLGMKFVNDEGFILSVYFSDLSLPFFNWYEAFFQKEFYQKNLDYVFYLIKEGQVTHLEFLTNTKKLFHVEYVKDNFNDISHLHKQNYLEICYQKVNQCLDKKDVLFMICVLRTFLSYHLSSLKKEFVQFISKLDVVTAFMLLTYYQKGFFKLPLKYHYSDINVSKTELSFYLANCYAHLSDPLLVHYAEKFAIVDDFHDAITQFFNLESFSDENILKKSLK